MIHVYHTPNKMEQNIQIVRRRFLRGYFFNTNFLHQNFAFFYKIFAFFYIKNFCFFTPIFLQQNFCFFYTNFFYIKNVCFFTPIFLHQKFLLFLHQFFTSKNFVFLHQFFLHQKLCFFTSNFEVQTTYFWNISVKNVHQFFKGTPFLYNKFGNMEFFGRETYTQCVAQETSIIIFFYFFNFHLKSSDQSSRIKNT